MLDRWRVGLLWIGAGSLVVFGLLAFALPDWAVKEFPWGVGPIMAQTMGGWALGTAAMAAMAAGARPARHDRLVGLHVYVWLFGSLQLLVVLAFRDRLQTGHLLTWPYLLGLLALTGSAASGVTNVLRERPDLRGPVGSVATWMRAVALGLGGFTALLAVGTLLAGPDGQIAQGGVVPEPMSLFTIRAFSAFFAAISAATFAVLLPSNPRAAWELDRGGFILTTLVLVAALLNIGAFDLAAKPAGLLYLGAYAVAAVVFAVIWALPRQRPDLFAADPPGS